MRSGITKTMGGKRKRPFLEDGDDLQSSNKERRVRFPKGKKVKSGDEKVDAHEEGPSAIVDPRLAAKERAKRRNEITAEVFEEIDASQSEVTYEDNKNFVEDGIQIEPFNLDQEREEGYFDAEGNFVEYINENEIKDAWLDSVEVDIRYAGKSSTVISNDDDDEDDDDGRDLSSDEIGIIKRRIADTLEPGETVLQALRRLKGGSNKSKEKMSTATQQLFDQLTEDANKLLDHGEYNVYQDKQEVFQREAEGYERLALARGKGTSISEDREDSEYSKGKDFFSSVKDLGTASSVNVDTSNPNASTAEISGNDVDAYDMFGDDGDDAIAKASSDISNLVSNTNSETEVLQSDYVYDENSGYYYSSSLGYYYDPSTGLYCHATSGQWYSYNEGTGTYDEIHAVASSAN